MASIDWARRFDHMQQHTGPARAVGGVRQALRRAHGQLSPRRGGVDDRPGARAVAGRDRRGGSGSEPRRLGGSAGDDPLRDGGRGGGAAAAQGIGARRDAAADRRRRRSTCRRAAARTSRGPARIGIIAVASWERFKGGQRLEFLCGGRALGRLRSFRDVVAASVRLLSVLPDELPAAIERMQGEAKDQKRAAAAAQNELARFRARGTGSGRANRSSRTSAVASGD